MKAYVRSRVKLLTRPGLNAEECSIIVRKIEFKMHATFVGLPLKVLNLILLGWFIHFFHFLSSNIFAPTPFVPNSSVVYFRGRCEVTVLEIKHECIGGENFFRLRDEHDE